MWKERVHDGITVYEYALEKPRTMKVFVARIDLTTPGIRFTATERLKNGWRKPIRTKDKSIDGKYLAETLLESTADFMMRRRASGTNVVLAVNAAFWRPWPQPKNENRADPIGLCIEDGEEVSAEATDEATGTFVVYRNGEVDIVAALDAEQRSNTAVAVSGLPIIMKDGKFTNPDDDSVYPRTAFGIAANRKTFVIIVVDGRQKGYSGGASLKDLHDIMLRLGVSDAVNMDGGGSSTLVVFDANQGEARMLNQQPGGQVRNTAVNLGIAFGDAHGQGGGASMQGGNDAWLDETARSIWTGEWSQGISYGPDGRAYIDGANIFAPYDASTGNVVTVEAKVSFHEDESDYTPDADAQAAVRLSTNGCFQVWTKELKVESGKLKVADESIWIDVAAEGVTPVSGEEYTLRTTFDYAAQTYSVAVLTGNADGPAILSRQDGGSPSHSFPLASSTNCVTSFAFVGDTYFTSLLGECRYEAIGFQPGEITVADANVILDAAKAAWLNARGDYAAVSNRLATVTSNEFATAWLCNLDIMNADASSKLSITRIDVGSDSVAVGVTLERTGAVAQTINGVLKFYGATALAAFREGTAAPLASTTLVDDDFSEGDTTTATFSKDGSTFFNAEIGE